MKASRYRRVSTAIRQEGMMPQALLAPSRWFRGALQGARSQGQGAQASRDLIFGEYCPPSFISISELADQSNCSSMLGTINGERVEGTRWLNMPRVSEPNTKNLVAFGGCPISGPPSTRPIRRTSTWGGRPGGRFR